MYLEDLVTYITLLIEKGYNIDEISERMTTLLADEAPQLVAWFVFDIHACFSSEQIPSVRSKLDCRIRLVVLDIHGSGYAR